MAIPNKSDFLETLPEDQYNAGLIKFNIPDEDRIDSLNGEGVWGWVSPEDKKKYDDDKYQGKITAILLNWPINYFGILSWGDELVLQCHGGNRPTLDPEWVKSNILNQ